MTSAGLVADALFTLRSSDGVTVDTETREIAERGSVRESLDVLFGIDVASLPLSGYVSVRATGASFRGSLLDNPTRGAHAVPGLLATGWARVAFPFFAIGGGFTSEVTLVNTDPSNDAGVTVTAFDADGGTIGSPFATVIGPSEREALNLETIFGSGSGVTVGRFVLDIQKTAPHPFASVPQLAGMVRVEVSAGAATAGPILNYAGNEFYFTPTRSDATEYTGLAVENTGAASITVTATAYASNGVVLDTEDFTVAPSATRSALLRELLSGALGQDGGFVKLTATANTMNTLALRG